MRIEQVAEHACIGTAALRNGYIARTELLTAKEAANNRSAPHLSNTDRIQTQSDLNIISYEYFFVKLTSG
jgi:hypothetical protein